MATAVQVEERETVRCSCCGLNQYRREAEKCLRCKASYAPPKVQVGSPETLPSPVADCLLARTSGLPVIIARNVKWFRNACGLSQKQFAERAGMMRTYISKVENQVCVPTLSTLEHLAKNLGVHPARLLEAERMAEFKTDDPYLLEFVEALPSLTSADRLYLIDMVRRLSMTQERRPA